MRLHLHDIRPYKTVGVCLQGFANIHVHTYVGHQMDLSLNKNNIIISLPTLVSLLIVLWLVGAVTSMLMAACNTIGLNRDK